MFQFLFFPAFALMQLRSSVCFSVGDRSSLAFRHFQGSFYRRQVAQEPVKEFDTSKQHYAKEGYLEGTVRSIDSGVLTIDLDNPRPNQPVSRQFFPVDYILDNKYDADIFLQSYTYILSDIKPKDKICVPYTYDKKNDKYYYTAIQILKRPGAEVPAAQRKSENGRVPYHVSQNIVNRISDGEKVPEIELRAARMHSLVDKLYPKPAPAKPEEKPQTDPMKK